ncbi:hypothetical protein DFH08DRAFT_696406 [Mycena albidolilacea]|uniref:Uncharacterized protein n=1 Tax=Mycena albidolilacea TaxID=1033008 RepID=A0AAD7A5P2_9AGAR|nr:hypothetical protein DFH08DRAFT_696406 [Mycena albidolilacea]
MLSFAVKYRKAIDAIAAERSLKLRKYELDEQEWKILGDLLMVLRAATLAFSTNSVSTIANVIPTMDKIDALLTLQGDKALHPSVRAATQFAKNCLNKYWFNADDSDVYRIAMILHPGMKMKYFRDAPWAGDEYIEEAKSLAQAAFGAYAIDTTSPVPATPSTSSSVSLFLRSFAQSAILIAL